MKASTINYLIISLTFQKPFSCRTTRSSCTIKNYRLDQNYPNPLNQTTNINFQLPVSEPVRVVIYDLKGKVIRELASKKFSSGEHTLIWDGKNSVGNSVTSGIYYYQMLACDIIQTRKMIIVR